MSARRCRWISEERYESAADGAAPELEALERVGIGYADPADRQRLWRWRAKE